MNGDRYRDAVLAIGALLDDAAEAAEDPERTIERITDLVLESQAAPLGETRSEAHG